MDRSRWPSRRVHDPHRPHHRLHDSSRTSLHLATTKLETLAHGGKHFTTSRLQGENNKLLEEAIPGSD
jgi:hypothetical protein